MSFIDREEADVLDFFQVLETRFNAGMSVANAYHGAFSTPISSTTTVTKLRWLEQMSQLRPWIGDRIIENLETDGFEVTARKWETTFGVNRDDVAHDNHGLYATAVDLKVQVAKRHKDVLAANVLSANTALAYDGVPLFSASHDVGNGQPVQNNIDTGGASSVWYLFDSRAAMKLLIDFTNGAMEQTSITDPKAHHVFMTDEFLWGMRVRYDILPGFWWGSFRSNQTLNETNLDAALVAIQTQKDRNGEPMGLSADTLMVAPANGLAARKLITSQFDAAGATNAFAGALSTPIINPFLP